MTSETAAGEPRPEPRPRRPKSRADAQMELIRERIGGYAEPGPLDWERNGIQFWVRKDFILVQDPYAQRARTLLGDNDLLPEPPPPGEPGPPPPAEAAPPPGESAPPPPAEAADVPPPDRPEPGPVEPPPAEPRDGAMVYGLVWIRLRPDGGAQRAAALVNRWYRDAAKVDVLVHITSTATSCPATEPVPVPLGTPADPGITSDRRAGEGVTVVVVDTGLDRRTARLLPWLRGVRGDPDPGVGSGGRPHEPYAGHGTFIAGVIRTMAPRARVVVRRGFPYAGSTFETELVAVLERVLDEDHPDVISLSAGALGPDRDDLAVLTAFADTALRRHKGVVIVAAAGNDGRSAGFWPAAAPWTTSVGALAADWHRRARFSNHGGWVDVYAPGEDLINAFPAGRFRYRERKKFNRPVRFTGMARWSGTSFATPLVAGLIAARMSRTGENGATAAAALVARGQANAIPGVGAVLRPGDDLPACHADGEGGHCRRSACC